MKLKTTVFAMVLAGSANMALAADYNFKLGVVTPTDHPHTISSKEFARLVDEKTDGKVNIRIFDNGSLGSNAELMDNVKLGIIDMTVNTPGVMAEYSPITGLFELPYIFADHDHMMAVTRGEVGQTISDVYSDQTGMTILGYFGGAQRNMITSKRSIESLDDLKSAKMRTWEWDIMINWWKNLGATGSVVSFPEVYTALQTGVVDGAENEFTTFAVSRWAEVAKNVAMTQHSITVRPLVVNNRSFSKMPEELQQAVQQAALEAADFDVDLEMKLDIENMEQLKTRYNVAFTYPDKAPFIENSLPIIKQYAQSNDIEPVLDQILAAAK